MVHRLWTARADMVRDFKLCCVALFELSLGGKAQLQCCLACTGVGRKQSIVCYVSPTNQGKRHCLMSNTLSSVWHILLLPFPVIVAPTFEFMNSCVLAQIPPEHLAKTPAPSGWKVLSHNRFLRFSFPRGIQRISFTDFWSCKTIQWPVPFLLQWEIRK